MPAAVKNGATTPDAEKTVDQIAQDCVLYILAQGTASTEEMIAIAGSDKSWRKAWKKLQDYSALTQRPYSDPGKAGFEYMLMNPDFSKLPADFVLKELFGEKPQAGVRYKDYQEISLTIRLDRPSIAPFPDEKVERLQVYRRLDDRIWLQSGYFRAMMRDAARMVPLDSWARKALENGWVHFEDVLLAPSVLTAKPLMAIAPEGKGFTYHECLPAGTELTFAICFPSVLTPENIRDIAINAGRYIGFSAAKHKLGYGKFSVLRAKVRDVGAAVGIE